MASGQRLLRAAFLVAGIAGYNVTENIIENHAEDAAELCAATSGENATQICAAKIRQESDYARDGLMMFFISAGALALGAEALMNRRKDKDSNGSKPPSA